MGLGILEVKTLERVPGTEYLTKGAESSELHQEDVPQGVHFKYDTSGATPIKLIPQPTDDPNDPLNWSIWKRDGITLVLCLVSIMAGTLGPILAPITLTLAFGNSWPLTDVALLTGYHLCGVGVAGFFFVPTARVWGKRHIYVLGTILLIVSSVWAGQAKSYKSLLWARIIQGVAVAPFESLVNTSIADLYCVHQRGIRMAFSNFSLYGGAFLTPVIVGKMTFDMHSWRWCFHFVAIFTAILLPFVIMFVPETAYRRNDTTDLAYTEDGQASRNSDASTGHCPIPIELETRGTNTSPSNSKGDIAMEGRYQKVSWMQSMALFNGRKTDETLWKLAVRPLPLLMQPAILWGMITQGALIGWTVMIGVVIASVFMQPPYGFSEVKTGYMYGGAFIGALIGFALSGWLADWSSKFMTRKNGGVYEPEFRIFLVIPQFILGVIGLFGFGITSGNPSKYNYMWPCFFFGIEVMGMVLGATGSALYLVDAHKDIAIESFTALLLFKNFFSFALTFKAFDWLNILGAWKIFWIVGVIQIVIGLTSIPMYIYGKRNRNFFHKHSIFKLLGLDK
ncbi:MFS transporter-like protein [Geopyxis carbonaria]|nr:MFS transporter-like protein [Geopyxis carbonaria]